VVVIKMKEDKNQKEMKRKTLGGMLLICLVLCVNGTVSAEDTTNKKKLFDESHHQFWCNCIDAGLADFATELRNNGYQVDRVTDGPLTYDKLKDYDVFVLPNGFVGKHSFDEGVKLLTDDEIKAIKKFVTEGGGLFLFGCGWSWVDYTHLSIEKAPVNQIGKELGIKLNDDIIYDSTNRYPGCSEGCPIFHRPFIKEHSITEDVYKITNCEGLPSSLTISDPSVNIIISGDEDSYMGYRGKYYNKGEKPPFIAVAEYGKGKIVFAGHEGFLSSADENNDGIKNLYEYDNKRLGLNIIDWLASYPRPFSIKIDHIEYPTEVDTSKSFTISVTVRCSFSVSNDAMVQVYEHAGALLGQNIEPLSGTSSKTYTFSLIAPSTPKTWKLNIHTFYRGEGPGGWVQDDIETIYVKVKPKPTPTPSLAKETASKLINTVSTKIDALKRKNVDISLIEQALSKAKDSYESEKYDEAYELAQNAQKMADDAYETAEHIESAQSEIDEAKSISADVTDAESKLKDAKDALNKGNYEYAKLWADEASELAKHASVGSVKIIDLKALATKYDQRTVAISGTIRDIKTVYGKGYTFALDDGSGMISVVYEGGLGDIAESNKVTVSGIFQASAGSVVADNVQKSGVGGVPGFEAIFPIAGLLAVAYLIRRRKEV